jgi:hypothetical protein
MKNIQISRILSAMVLALGLVGCSNLTSLTQPVAAKSLPPVQEVKSMLWVGNSFFYYNNSMHGHVGQLLNAAGQKGNRSTSATISGSGML